MRIVLAALLALLVGCANAPPYERGMTQATREALGPVKVSTIVVQQELGAQYSTRSTTAKVLNTAKINGVAYGIAGTVYIGPAPNSITAWIDTSDYVPNDVGDVPGVVGALDPSNAVRFATKIALAPVLRATERREHAKSGKAAYERIASARIALATLDLPALFKTDQAAALAQSTSITVASHELANERPDVVLRRLQADGTETALLLFIQYALTPDLRQLHVETDALLVRKGDTREAPTYRNRFVYDSPRFAVPGKTADWDGKLAPVLLERWLAGEASLLKSELARASTLMAAELERDLAGIQTPTAAPVEQSAEPVKE
jgi:hypothetical protein